MFNAPPLETCAGAPEGSNAVHVILPTETVEGANLFNKQLNLVVMAADDDPSTYADRRRDTRGLIYNPRPKAPEHIGMINNLANQRSRPKPAANLVAGSKMRKLSKHMQLIGSDPLGRCCFHCGMMSYPKEGDEIVVQGVRQRADCRAYRVFRYYIRARAKEIRRRMLEQDRQRDGMVRPSSSM